MKFPHFPVLLALYFTFFPCWDSSWSRDWMHSSPNFASCTLKWSIIWSEYEAGNIYAYIGEGMQRLGKHSPWYVESKEIPFSMDITARSVLTLANGLKYMYLSYDTYLNKVWCRYQPHFLTLNCIYFFVVACPACRPWNTRVSRFRSTVCIVIISKDTLRSRNAAHLPRGRRFHQLAQLFATSHSTCCCVH